MTNSTRDQLLAAAARLFADRGFSGTSIAAVADQLQLTKQALLHHFGSKEQLYGAVLAETADRLLARTDLLAQSADTPEQRLEALVLTQYEVQMEDPHSARLIMRELLDNEPRAGRAGSWYLRPYLETLMGTACECAALRDAGPPQALAVIYQLLGAAHYFAVSQPTLQGMFGAATLSATRAQFADELRTLVRARLGLA